MILSLKYLELYQSKIIGIAHAYYRTVVGSYRMPEWLLVQRHSPKYCNDVIT